jgi:hypothetical protein
VQQGRHNLKTVRSARLERERTHRCAPTLASKAIRIAVLLRRSLTSEKGHFCLFSKHLQNQGVSLYTFCILGQYEADIWAEER